MAGWSEMVNQAKGFFAGLSARDRAIALAGLGLILSGLLYCAFFWTGADALEPVVETPFDMQTQIKALEALDAAGIRASVRQGTISVPREKVGMARLVLAKENALPEDKKHGFLQILSTNPFPGRHELDKNYQVALQNELAQTIMAIDAVEWAKVIISPGDAFPSPIHVDRELGRPKAAVTLRLRRAKAPLPEETVEAVRSLVASSWKELRPEDVAVGDTTGRPYPVQGQQSLAQANNILKLQVQIEEYYKRKIESQFPMLPGTVAFVNAKLKASEVQKHIARVNPDETVALHEKTIEERKEHTAENPVEVGVTSNVGGLTETEKNPNKLVDTRTEGDTAYDVTRIIEDIKEHPGEVGEITASVMFPNRPDPATLGGGEVKFVPFAADELSQFRTMVAKVCGVKDEDVGEKVAVSAFNPSPELYAPPPAWWREALMTLLRRPEKIGLAVVAVVALLLLYRIARSMTLPAPVPAAEAAAAAAAEAEAAAAMEIKLPELSEQEKMEESVRRVVKSNPQVAANLIRRWLMEES